MEKIDLEAKLKALEAEVDAEIVKKNEETMRIWEELTGSANKNNGQTDFTEVSNYMNKSVKESAVTDFSEVNSFNEIETSNQNNSFNEIETSNQSNCFNEIETSNQSNCFNEITEITATTDFNESTDNHITMEMLNEPVITKDDFTDHSKWAVVLAGGGGKGSYQIGAWKALRELKVWNDVIAVSGSSVGSLNAALMSLGDYDVAENIWKNIMPDQFLDINDSMITGSLGTLLDRTKTDGICSRDGLIRILNSLPLEKLPSAAIPAYACIAWYTSDCLDCMNEKPVAEYISLSEVDVEDAKKILLASSAMPYIYPPEIIHDRVSRDGGLADNVPVMPMTTIGADKLIVIKLDPLNKVNTSLYRHFKEVVEIKPSRDIGDLLDGTLDFNKDNVLFRMLLGYYDTLRTFSMRMYSLNKLPLSQAELKRREEEDFERILATVRSERALSSADGNINKLNKILEKF